MADLALGDEVYVGLFLCSHNADVVERAVFRDVRIIRPAREGFVPYRDYIGSHLEVLDARHRPPPGPLQLRRSPFEAPNWTPDGAALIYNTSGRGEGRGRLHRFDLATRQPTLIDTGFANRNNNDHVLSFDGTMLGISDQSTDEGQLHDLHRCPPAAARRSGSRRSPRRTSTAGRPTGSSSSTPVGATASSTSTRSPPTASGQEVKLTDRQGPRRRARVHARRQGHLLQLHAQRPDADLADERPTGPGRSRSPNDDFNNWFPHISPDGRSIVFISYGKEIAPADHPYYKQVYLRLMPIEGGPAKVIAYVYGGQGTINVPSWSPDGRMIAFVSNSDQP